MVWKRMIAAGVLIMLYPLTAVAVVCPPGGPLCIDTGVHSDIPTIMAGIVNLLLIWSGMVTTALFMAGAIWMVGSGGDEARVTTGKKIMKASLIGLAIILSSWLILSTAVFFIAG